MDLSSLPPEFLQRMTDLMSSGKLQIPPPIFTDMEGEIVDINLTEKTLTVRFPVQKRYQNPMGYMQGGMIATAIDNAIGPLSFMVAAPNVTKTMEVNYLRPISTKIENITVVASFAGQHERELTFVADVLRDDGAKLAHARSINVIMKRNMMGLN